MHAGRGGSCELMIGCIAKAAASELHPDMEEMDDVRWIHKDVVKQVVHASSKPDHPYLGALFLKKFGDGARFLSSLFERSIRHVWACMAHTLQIC